MFCLHNKIKANYDFFYCLEFILFTPKIIQYYEKNTISNYCYFLTYSLL